jgi:hypothetical protein
MKKVYRFVVLIAILGYVFRVGAEEPQILKTWSFQGKEGTVNMRLTRAVGSNGKTATVLHIYSPGGTIRSTPEEAKFLAEVLSDFQKMHIDVQSLDWMSFRLSEPEAIARLASFAASSRRWRKAVATNRAATYYPLVAPLLNESDAYKEWEQVFQQYNLALNVAGVEEVILEPFSKTQGTCRPTTTCGNLRVPTDALVQMNVTPIARH